MNVRLLARARADVERIDGWWRRERPRAPLAFVDDLDRAFRLLQQQPELGPAFGHREGRTIRRLLLERTQVHVYYLRPADDVIVVLRVWRAVRGRPPALR